MKVVRSDKVVLLMFKANLKNDFLKQNRYVRKCHFNHPTRHFSLVID